MKWEPSAAWYVGVPRAGKTRLAISHAIEAARASGWPVLAVDSQGVSNFSGWPRARSAADAVERVFGLRQSVAYLPSSAEDFDSLILATMRTGSVHLLVDEASYWLDSTRGKNGPLVRLLRTYRHAGPTHAGAHVLLTTQHLSGDVPQAALSCAPTLYVFRCTSPTVLDRLEREYGVDRELVRNLEQGRFLEIRTGF